MTPLAGIKVVELARILAGPWAGQVLADPQIVARGMVLDLGEGLKGLRTPIRFSDAELALGKKSPKLGENPPRAGEESGDSE